jgi:hypothetical protein
MTIIRRNSKLEEEIDFDAILDDGRIVMPSYDEDFDLFGAIALSKKLGRVLTDEESKQFIRKRNDKPIK